MDSLPDSVLLQILSRLNDSADVARCRVASKALNTVFPEVRSIKLRYSLQWHEGSRCIGSRIKPFKMVFQDLIWRLKTVESVCIGFEILTFHEWCDIRLTDGDFAKEWLPRVSGSLKSLSITDGYSRFQSDILPLISKYCHNLVNLKLANAWLTVHDLNPMPILTSLTLTNTILEDENLNELNKCFPNLQVLNLLDVNGLKDPKIHLPNLKTCLLRVEDTLRSLTLITPNLIKFEFDCMVPAALHLEAPMLSYFNLTFDGREHASTFTTKKFENLKTLQLDSIYFESLLSEFPITLTVENLTLGMDCAPPRLPIVTKLTLGSVFTVFPNVTSLRINPNAWSELEASLNPDCWEILDGKKTLKTVSVYLMLVDPSLTFSSIGRVLDQCASSLEVSLLVHVDDVGTLSREFMSECVARWPRLKWKWGIWTYGMEEDSWIT